MEIINDYTLKVNNRFYAQALTFQCMGFPMLKNRGPDDIQDTFIVTVQRDWSKPIEAKGKTQSKSQ